MSDGALTDRQLSELFNPITRSRTSIQDSSSVVSGAKGLTSGGASDKDFQHLKSSGAVAVPERYIESCSIDLPIGERAWEVSAIPNLAGGFRLDEFLDKHCYNEFSSDELREGDNTLNRNSVYLVELDTVLNLPPRISGYCNPKSSSGRIDLLVSIIAERNDQMNEIPSRYAGKLYMVVVPQSWPIKLVTGESLAQMRLFKGSRQIMEDWELQQMDQNQQLIEDDCAEISSDGLVLHIDLETEPTNFVAERCGRPIPLNARDELDPTEYFRHKPVKEGTLRLEPGEFILAQTTERVRIPTGTCATLLPYREKQGEFRSHYAGFFDRGFGYGRKGEIPGCTAVCELRNMATAPILISHGQPVAILQFERLAEEPEVVYGEDREDSAEASHYVDQQRLELAKFFQDWPENFD